MEFSMSMSCLRWYLPGRVHTRAVPSVNHAHYTPQVFSVVVCAVTMIRRVARTVVMHVMQCRDVAHIASTEPSGTPTG